MAPGNAGDRVAGLVIGDDEGALAYRAGHHTLSTMLPRSAALSRCALCKNATYFDAQLS